MSIFFRDEKKIKEMLREYFVRVDDCMNQFRKDMLRLIEDGPASERVECGEIHSLESSADDLRRDIELKLYGKALLPESRGDLLGLLETFDTVPNSAETVVAIIETEQIKIPDQFKKEFRELVECNFEAYLLLKKTADVLFETPKETLACVKEVDIKESDSDHMEQILIRNIFSSDLEKADKILLKDVVVAIGNVSDRSENAGDRMAIIAIKRRI